ncbi:lipase [Amycolatopsis minnesotensis]|uniref:Alpha/beta fold hydrolase n=1 Tax=Amycolatopsis minnesotensis TaxID=337894 RepID=A0ABN2SV70_9PSEU
MTKPFRSFVAVLAAAAVLSAVTVPASAAPARGALLSATPVETLSLDATRAQLAASPFGADHVRHGVNAYRLEYRTIDGRGRPTTASGLVALPDGGPHVLPTVAYLHGTRVGKRAVASVDAHNADRPAAYTFAAAGYATVAPDYLGLGTGPGFHPYLDSATETSASVDMLRAARSFARRQAKALDPKVRVTGFSQGGQAAMVLGRALRSGVDGRFALGALAPVSGPYDVLGAELPGVFDGSVSPGAAVFYLSYWTVAMNRAHHIYSNPAEVFKAPYASTIEKLFDGSTDDDVIAKTLPAKPSDLFTDAYLSRLRHPSGGLLEAAHASDGACDWRPPVPVPLYAGTADTDVPVANSVHCQRDLRAEGARARVLNVGHKDHFGTAFTAIPRIVDQFDRGQ